MMPQFMPDDIKIGTKYRLRRPDGTILERTVIALDDKSRVLKYIKHEDGESAILDAPIRTFVKVVRMMGIESP